MKRIAPLFLILLLASCASTQKLSCIATCPDNYVIVPRAIFELCDSNKLPRVPFCIVDNKDMIMQIDKNSMISVSTGFVDSFRENDLYISAIAHELAHYKLQHIWKQNGIAIGTSLVFTVADFFIPGIAYADWVVNPTIGNAFSRSCELDADVEAVRLCQGYGMLYAPQKFIALMNRFHQLDPHERGISIIWASHPNVSDRIENIKKVYGIP